MSALFKRTLDQANRHAGKLFLAGLVGVTLINGYKWRQDKALLAKVKDTPKLPALEAWPRLPRVSVLVAAWNEAAHIERHIESFIQLRYPNKELVLCAGGEDGTFGLARHWEGSAIKVLEQKAGEGKQRALYQNLLNSSGEIIFLTDADCILDDYSFEHTLYPVAVEGEHICTGSSKPLPEQIENPFVLSQAATHIYGAYKTTEYTSGLLGRNCAVERNLLIKSQGLNLLAPTGTDYVLAKALIKTGARIRQIPNSQIASHFPCKAQDYLRQQRRFVWNVWHYGRYCQAETESILVLFNVLVGWMMIMLPIMVIFGGPLLWSVWSLLLLFGSLSRMRYLWFLERLLGLRVRLFTWLSVPLYLILDFAVWAAILPEFIKKEREW